MSSFLFKTYYQGKSNKINRELIKQLTEIRVAGFNIDFINQVLSKNNIEATSVISKQLGSNIIKVNLLPEKRLQDYKDSSTELFKIIDQLAKHQQVALLIFGAQLIQFYTVIADKHFNPQTSFKEFYTFLLKNIKKFGDISHNLFVAEYLLIKIFNEVAETITLTKDPKSVNSIQPAPIDFINQEFKKLEHRITTWTNESPTNIFIQYLAFGAHYTGAQLIELQYYLNKHNLSKEECMLLAKNQESFIKHCNETLERITLLEKKAYDRVDYYPEGTEFCLGRGLFDKLPYKSLTQMQEHINYLLKANNSE